MEPKQPRDRRGLTSPYRARISPAVLTAMTGSPCRSSSIAVSFAGPNKGCFRFNFTSSLTDGPDVRVGLCSGLRDTSSSPATPYCLYRFTHLYAHERVTP